MSHDSAFGLQSPAIVRPCPCSFARNHLSSADLHVQPLLQQKADEPFCETNGHVQEPRPASYQSIDSVLETLQLEIGRHNETRLTLQTSRETNFELEQLLFQERSFNHSLRVRVQEAEIERIVAEGKLQTNEHQNLHNESSQSTPLSDYKSATLSPAITLLSMRDMTSDTLGGKRKADLATSIPATPKRLRSTINLATPKPVDLELEKGELEEDLEEGELEEEANDSGRSSVFSLLV